MQHFRRHLDNKIAATKIRQSSSDSVISSSDSQGHTHSCRSESENNSLTHLREHPETHVPVELLIFRQAIGRSSANHWSDPSEQSSLHHKSAHFQGAYDNKHSLTATGARVTGPSNSSRNNATEKRGGSEDSDHDGRRKRQKQQPGSSNTKAEHRNGRKFACPYFKKNARKYSRWTSCPGPGWDEVHRVKTHLYRRHALPIQCPRCWKTYETQVSLNTHLQASEICQPRQNVNPVEGISKEQEGLLRRRTKTDTDEEKWREIWMILFPDDDRDSIPSPYYDQTIYVDDYFTFARQEAPMLLERELEGLSDEEFRDINRLRRSTVRIVQEVQSRLFDLYQQSLNGQDASSTGSGTTTSSDSTTALTPPTIPEPTIRPNKFAETVPGFALDNTEGEEPAAQVPLPGANEFDDDTVEFGLSMLTGVGGLPEPDPILDAMNEFADFVAGPDFDNFGLEFEDLPGLPDEGV